MESPLTCEPARNLSWPAGLFQFPNSANLLLFRYMLKNLVLAGTLLAVLCRSVAAGEFQHPRAVHLDHDGERWAQKTLKKLSLEEKIGQMIMIRIIMPQFVNLRNPDYLKWLEQI